MARILIVGGGCRGRRLASQLVQSGHALRVTTRSEERRDAVEATGAECWIGTPDRLATLRGALDSVTVACWMLAGASGTADQVAALHSSRLEFFISQAIDTTVRGLVYDAWPVAAADVCAESLSRGAQVVGSLTQLNAIPAVVLTSDDGKPGESQDDRDDSWIATATAAVDSLLGAGAPRRAERCAGQASLLRDRWVSTMTGERPRYGQLVAAFGAVLLAVAVFLPWYGVSFTSNGLAYAQQVGNQVASQFGNATLQGYMSSLHSTLAPYVGHEFLSLSAHQALKTVNVVLLIAGGLGCVLALLALAGATPAQGNGGAVALLGLIAACFVSYRMVSPPNPAADVISLSLREGAWLALIGSLAMVAGGLWPVRKAGSGSRETDAQDVWSGLSGWTPEA